jgi:hypothetical protein
MREWAPSAFLRAISSAQPMPPMKSSPNSAPTQPGITQNSERQRPTAQIKIFLVLMMFTTGGYA